jgi:hypothetical protein
MYSPGDIVDLNDRLFGWRGVYTVMPTQSVTSLIKIKNQGTGSQQFVSADRLRKGRLSQFFLKGLRPK